jgi:nascent polypeptide-associated complex subunit alpha|tara:strand:- start:19933 stop:20262 length:330 start_codon:yes stop_codon:yes gene_type:complete
VLPNLNPKQLEKAMKRMGMSVDEIDAEEVLIKLRDGGQIIISEPQVAKMNMQGQDSFQISGTVSEGEVEPSDSDIEMVVQQAGVSEDAAREALKNSGNDIAKAILSLQN